MPSRRQSSEMFSSPRRPSSTMRIFSSAEYCRRVWRRIVFSTCSAGAFSGPDFCFIFAPCGYDEPEILPSESPSLCLMSADGEHDVLTRSEAMSWEFCRASLLAVQCHRLKFDDKMVVAVDLGV